MGYLEIWFTYHNLFLGFETPERCLTIQLTWNVDTQWPYCRPALQH